MATSIHPGCLSALRAGNMSHLQALLKEDPTRFYGRTVKGNNILHITASLGNVHILSLLMDHQAGWQMTGELNQRGDSALHLAARGGHANVVRQLLDVGVQNMASVVNEDEESPLYLAVERASVETVKILLEFGMVDYRGPLGQTALHAAVYHRSYDIAKMLLEKMPGLNLQVDASQSAPIHYAVSIGYIKMVRLLLQKDATVVHLLDSHGFSAIHIAASKDFAYVIKEILHHCPDATELTDSDGNNFLHVAAKMKAKAVVKLVLSNPLLRQSINETNHEGNTPLHLAAMNQYFAIHRLLLSDSRVDNNVLNYKGLTHLDVVSSIDDFKFYYCKALMINKMKSTKFVSHRMRTIMVKVLYYADNMLDYLLMDTVNREGEGSSDEKLDRLRAMENNLSIIAALIATVTFAAAFTLPGGYNNDDNNKEPGTAILAQRTSFKMFVIFDTIAMSFSLSIILLLICCNLLKLKATLRRVVITIAIWFLKVAVEGMLVAFFLGIHVVWVPKCQWLDSVIKAIIMIPAVICIAFLCFSHRNIMQGILSSCTLAYVITQLST